MNASTAAPLDRPAALELVGSGVGAVVSAPVLAEGPRTREKSLAESWTLHGAAQAGIDPATFTAVYTGLPCPVLATVGGDSPAEFARAAQHVADSDAALVQCDFSSLSPNGRSFGYSWELMEGTLELVRGTVTAPLGAFLPVMFDLTSIEYLCLMAMRTGIQFITAITPLRIGFAVDPHSLEPIIQSNDGVGQLSGTAIRPLGTAQVRLYYEQLRYHIDVVGNGGVDSGEDVVGYLAAGARAVQVGSAYDRRGAQVFRDLQAETSSLLERGGRNTTHDVIGALR